MGFDVTNVTNISTLQKCVSYLVKYIYIETW